MAGGRVVNDRDWNAAYHRRLEEVGEDHVDIEFKAHPDVNPEGNKSWKAYIKRPTLFQEIAELSLPAFFINAGKDIRPS